MNEPKILCITNDFGPRAGGIESFVIGLIERLPKNSVIVYTSSQDGSFEFDQAWQKNFGVEVIRDRSKVLLPTLRVGRSVARTVQEHGIQRVFFGAAAPLGLLAPGLRRAGIKQIVALTHGHEVWWAKVFPFNLALRRIGKYVDHLTYLGEFTKREISRALSSDAQAKMIRVAPGIDTKHFSPVPSASSLRSELGLSNAKVIVSVGRLVHRKGQDFLIKALPAIKTSIPNVHLLLVGSGPYEAHLRKLVKELKVESSVSFLGRVPYKDLPRYICLGDVFAMPSRSRLAGLEVEGLGIVYLEASSCGLPVIAGLSGGAPDAVLEGETGYCVDGTDTQAISSALVKVLSDSALAEVLGNRGREWIVQSWRWEIWSSEFARLLKLNLPL
jgi:phosphatidylinositol alpha-1,6-mannosyltransferase